MCEIVTIRHFKRKHDTGQRSAEYGGHARCRTTDEHDPAVTVIESKAPELGPYPGPDRCAAVDAGTLKCSAAPKADSSNSRQQLWKERPHVDVTLVLVVRANDLLGGVLVRIRRHELHDQPRDGRSEDDAGNDGPMVAKIDGEHRGPKLAKNDYRDRSDGKSRRDPDERGDKEPLLKISRVNSG